MSNTKKDMDRNSNKFDHRKKVSNKKHTPPYQPVDTKHKREPSNWTHFAKEIMEDDEGDYNDY